MRLSLLVPSSRFSHAAIPSGDLFRDNYVVLTFQPKLRSRMFLGGVGFLTTIGAGAGFFVRLRLRKSNWIIFTSHS